MMAILAETCSLLSFLNIMLCWLTAIFICISMFSP